MAKEIPSARSVVSLRLSDAEREAVETAAQKRRITPSEFLRQAALLVAHRLTEATKPKIRPVEAPPPEPLEDDGPHLTRTYRSLEEYRAGSFATGRDYGAEAVLAQRKAEDY